MSLLLTTVAPALFGAFLRIWAEERKDNAERRKFELAIMTGKMEILDQMQQRIVGSTFLQMMVMSMTFVALGALVVFPMFAVWQGVPFFVVMEGIQETGFLFWQKTIQVKELVEINGLYLPEDFHLIIQGAVSLIFGNVTAGIGRR